MSCALYLIAYLSFWWASKSNMSTSLLSVSVHLVAAAVWIISTAGSTLLKETGVTLAGVAVATSGISLLDMIGSQISRSPSGFSFRALLGHPLWLWEWATRHLVWVLISICTVIAYICMRMVLAAYDPVELFASFSGGTVRISVQEFLAWWGNVIRQGGGLQSGLGGSLYLGKSDLIRRAENPFAFLVGREKALSIAYLHFRYMFVMVWPAELSPEYAYDCIPKVSTLGDLRNLYSSAMYGILLIIIVVGIAKLLWQTSEGAAIRPSALLLSVVWLVVPFLPASAVRYISPPSRCFIFSSSYCIYEYCRFSLGSELCWQSDCCTCHR